MKKKDILKLIFKLIMAFICGLGIAIVIFGIIVWCFQDKFLFYPSFDNDSFNILKEDSSFEEIVIKENDLPIVIKYYKKEYILKTTPKGIVLIKKEY